MKRKALSVVDEMTQSGWPEPKLAILNPEDYVDGDQVNIKQALSDLRAQGFEFEGDKEIFDVDNPLGSGSFALGNNQHVLTFHADSSSYLLGEYSDFPFKDFEMTDLEQEQAELFTVYHELAHMYSAQSWLLAAEDVGVKIEAGSVSDYLGQLSDEDNKAKVLRAMDESVSDSFATYMCLRDGVENAEVCEKIMAVRALTAQSGASVKYQTAAGMRNSFEIAKDLGSDIYNLDSNKLFELSIKSGIEIQSYDHGLFEDPEAKQLFTDEFHEKSSAAAALQAGTVYNNYYGSKRSSVKEFMMDKMSSDSSKIAYAENKLLIGKGHNEFIRGENQEELYQQGKDAINVVYKNQLKQTPEYHRALSQSLQKEAELTHAENEPAMLEPNEPNKDYEINR